MAGGLASSSRRSGHATAQVVKTITLKPGGYHLMLMKPQRPFKEGERVPLTLKFEKAGEVTVELAVDKPNAMGKDDHAGHAGMKTQ